MAEVWASRGLTWQGERRHEVKAFPRGTSFRCQTIIAFLIFTGKKKSEHMKEGMKGTIEHVAHK
jgi:hypothetical protein